MKAHLESSDYSLMSAIMLYCLPISRLHLACYCAFLSILLLASLCPLLLAEEKPVWLVTLPLFLSLPAAGRPPGT